MVKRNKGFAWLPVIVILSLIGTSVIVLKPKILDGESKRAAASTAATEAVEKAETAKGASAAAGVVKIGEANTEAPESPSKSFIAREVPVVLAKLPSPDPMALIEAEKRKNAVMQGRMEEASLLYTAEAKRSAQLQKERDEAIAERKAIDLKLEQTAALHLGEARQRNIMIAAVVVLAAGLIWVKFTNISPRSLGRALADIRAGENPVNALDVHLPPWLHASVKKASQLATEPSDMKPNV